MAFDERLADRVRRVFNDRHVIPEEKRMMGGLCFLVNGKMCIGILQQRLMVRLDPEIYEQALTRPGCVPMDFTGRPMRGFVFVNPGGHRSKRNLESWLSLALDFNPRARASPRRTAAQSKATGTRRKRPIGSPKSQ